MQTEIQPGVQNLGNNITKEWLLDGPILVFTGQEATRLAVDTWADALKAELLSWPQNTPLHVINDFSSPRSSLTPYAKSKADELIKLRPDTFGYTGLVIQANFAGRLIRLWYGAASMILKVQTRIFYKREDAVVWIRAMIAQDKVAKEKRAS